MVIVYKGKSVEGERYLSGWGIGIGNLARTLVEALRIYKPSTPAIQRIVIDPSKDTVRIRRLGPLEKVLTQEQINSNPDCQQLGIRYQAGY